MITISLPAKDIQELGRSVDNISRKMANTSAHVLAYGSRKQYGKMHRLAVFALSYGAGYKRASFVSGLGLRRVRVIAKQLRSL